MPAPTIQELNNLAQALFAGGRVEEGLNALQHTIALYPESVEVRLNLGAALRALGRPEDARQAFEQALAVCPDSADACAYLALVLRESEKTEQAIAIYRRLLALRPTDGGALNDLGNLLAEKGDLAGSIELLRRAVAAMPSLAEVHFNLANGLYQNNQKPEAIEHYRHAAALKPAFFEAHYHLASALAAGERYDEAAAAYRQAVAIRPDHFDGLANFGIALDRLGKYEEAVAAYRQALAIKAASPELLCNLGSSLHSLEREAEAMDCYQKAIAIRPDFPEAVHNLGNSLERAGRDDEAVAMQRRALELRPDFPEALNGLGSLHYYRGELDQAGRHLQRALELRPNYPDARLNMALLRLVQGDLKAGWEGYEARWEMKKLTAPRNFRQPVWDGSDLNGKRILLHVEQGLGDAIQFVRYVPLVQARRGRVIVRCWPALKRLFAGQLGIEHVFEPSDPVPEFDVHLPLVSVARVLGTTLETIPAKVPYLMPEPELVARWQKRLAIDSQFKVGLVWAGNPKHGRDRSRSIPLSMFAPLGQIPGIRLFSLQKGEQAQAKHPPAGLELVDFTAELIDLADTAALIQNLDLVISVDTAVVHLAGALAKPVWVLVNFMPDWRWLLNRPDSPWYPTLRLFRQAGKDDWSEPLSRVAGELSAHARR